MVKRNNKCLKISLSELKKDHAFKENGRGARKLLVTEIFRTKEYEANTDTWITPGFDEKCAVLSTKDSELAVFTEKAKQDRHYHKLGTEIYMLIEGSFYIEVENVEYSLDKPGDMIIVHPFSVHEVINKGNEYICRVVTLNCRGDKRTAKRDRQIM